ncbi:hypothetical protein GCWU000342_01030 [Shuttleworthella satelles DSM 14600]|uniref:Uncharacterized protein n=1 Tax=Shuttleworthella satelles DSM 14600 TaxID=626523 RepID=C4GAS9_9FIRM|nr:hypothetical protein GCWU000342_01030 [Shuttleworthia satelles DSM 14600]
MESVMTILADVLKILPVQGHRRIIDRLRRDMPSVMDKKSCCLMALFTQASVNPPPMLDVTIPALMPGFTGIEPLCIPMSHIAPPSYLMH